MIKIIKQLLNFDLKEGRAILLICMGIAFIFWLLVKLSQTYRTDKSVLIEAQMDESLAFVKLPPDDLTVELEGTGWDLMFDYFYEPSTILTYELNSKSGLSLSGGQLRADIKEHLYTDGLKIMDVNYDNLNLVLEKKASKMVPVVVQDSFSFAPEYQLKGEIQIEPDSVLIAGPASMIEPIVQWPTKDIIAKDLKNPFTRTVKLQQPPEELSLSLQNVKVDVEVEPFTEKSMYVPIIVQNAPDSISIFPEKINVSCKLGLSKYDEISYRDFTAEVNLKGISPNAPNNTVPILLTKQPAFVRGVHFSPKSAKFFFVEENKKNPAEN